MSQDNMSQDNMTQDNMFQEIKTHDNMTQVKGSQDSDSKDSVTRYSEDTATPDSKDSVNRYSNDSVNQYSKDSATPDSKLVSCEKNTQTSENSSPTVQEEDSLGRGMSYQLPHEKPQNKSIAILVNEGEPHDNSAHENESPESTTQLSESPPNDHSPESESADDSSQEKESLSSSLQKSESQGDVSQEEESRNWTQNGCDPNKSKTVDDSESQYSETQHSESQDWESQDCKSPDEESRDEAQKSRKLHIIESHDRRLSGGHEAKDKVTQTGPAEEEEDESCQLPRHFVPVMYRPQEDTATRDPAPPVYDTAVLDSLSVSSGGATTDNLSLPDNMSGGHVTGDMMSEVVQLECRKGGSSSTTSSEVNALPGTAAVYKDFMQNL